MYCLNEYNLVQRSHQESAKTQAKRNLTRSRPVQIPYHLLGSLINN